MGEFLPIQRELRRYASPGRAKTSSWFFKTEPGSYGHGDVFIGVSVPDQRRVARAHRDLPLESIAQLLASPIHEDRLLAAILLADRASRRDADIGRLGRFYLAHIDRFNNWDIIDSSAPYVLGRYFERRSRAPLRQLATSPSLWRRRIAVLTTGWFIRRGECRETLRLARRLLADRADLIHKAVGWMLREVGKRDADALRRFLDAHASRMPRTMLRYAIERIPQHERSRYLVTHQK